MTTALFKKERELFEAVLEMPTGERESYLESACNDAPELRAGVEQLLRSHETAADLFGDGENDLTPKPVDLEAPGTRLGDYELTELVGEGAMGVVYRARQLHPLQREVAVKIIRPGLDTRNAIARFEMERQALARMEHPGIAKVFDAGVTSSGRPYFAMEFISGVPITKYCDAQSMTVDARARLFLKVCSAVQHAHQRGLIHRDLKPSNILVVEHDGEPAPVVIDFGIAKRGDPETGAGTLLTREGLFVGTPDYMAPEQTRLSGAQIDTRADVYSLGTLLYELLVGQPPFVASGLTKQTYVEMVRIICEQPPPKPSRSLTGLTAEEREQRAAQRKTSIPRMIRQLNGDLDWIVLKAMEKEPDRRYATVDALAEDIARSLNDLPVIASPPSALYRMKKFIQRHKMGTVTTALVLLSITIGTAASVTQSIRATAAERAAEAELERSQRVTQFLLSVLQLEPSRESQTQLKVSTILADAETRVPQAFGDDPLTQAEMFTVLAKSYRSLGAFRESAQAAKAGIALLKACEPVEVKKMVDAAVVAMLSLDEVGEYQESQRVADDMLKSDEISYFQRRILGFRRAMSLRDADPEGAREALLKLVSELDPQRQNSAYYEWIYRLEIAGIAVRMERWADAVAELEPLIQAVPDQAPPISDQQIRCHVLLASAWMAMGREEEARRLLLGLASTLEELPDQDKLRFFETTVQALRFYRLLGQVLPAAELAEWRATSNDFEILPAKRNEDVRWRILLHQSLQLAVGLESAERIPEAIAILKPFFDEGPESIDPTYSIVRKAYHKLALLHTSAGELDESLRMLETEATWENVADSENVELYIALSEVHVKRHDSDAAVRVAKTAMGFDSLPEGQFIRLLALAAQGLAQTERYDEVRDLLEPELDLLKRSAPQRQNPRGVLRELAGAYEALNAPAQAKELREFLKALNPQRRDWVR